MNRCLFPIVAYKNRDTEAGTSEFGVIGGESVEFAEGKAVAYDVNARERVGAVHGAEGSEARCDGAIGVAIGVSVNIANGGVGVRDMA